MTDRIPDLVRIADDHARTISVLVDNHGRVDVRLSALETAERNRQILEAREEERDKATAEWRSRIEDKVDRFENAVNRLIWVVVSAVVVAFVTWLLKGGLSI